jgi:hypothetical protein
MTEAEEKQIRDLELAHERALNKVRELPYLLGRGAERNYSLACAAEAAYKNSLGGPIRMTLKKKYR